MLGARKGIPLRPIARGIKFKMVSGGLDTSGSTGRLVLHMLAAVAQFERDLIVERTRAALAAAKKSGRKFGAPVKWTPERSMRAVLLPEANILEVAANRARILVYGWVEYDDIFFRDNAPTVRHRTEFCMEVLVTPQANGAGLLISDRSHIVFNGSEAECGERFVQAQARRPVLTVGGRVEAL